MRTPRTSVPLAGACARVALAVLFTVPVFASIAGANLLANPSVETGPAPGEAVMLPVGSTAITGWTVTRNAIDYCETRWDAAEGVRSIALNGVAAGGIAQSFATSPGGIYTVSFFMGGDAFSAPIMKHMRVTAAGLSQDYEFDATHAWPWGMGWLEKTFVFTANAASTTLEFYSLDTGLDVGPTLDNVTVAGPFAGVPPAFHAFALAVPRPNPASRQITVSFEIPTESPVRVTVLDLQGREVAVLASGTMAAGPYTRTWNGGAGSGHAHAGVYLIRLEAPGISLVQKAVFAR